MNKILAPLLVVGCMFVANLACAEVKIGFVDSQRILRILNDSPQAAKLKKKLEKEFEKRDQELLKLTKQIQSAKESLEKSSATLTESDRATKIRELGELDRNFQRKEREFKEDLNLRQNEEVAAMFERANKVIKGIAETDKYDIIFQEAVYFNPRIDLTDKVIRALTETAK